MAGNQTLQPERPMQTADGKYYWDGRQWLPAGVPSQPLPPTAAPVPQPFGGASPQQQVYAQPFAPPAKTWRGRQKLVEKVQPMLPPGEHIRHIFPASTRGVGLLIALEFLAILPGALIYLLVNHNRIVAVTLQGVYIVDCGHFGLKPKRLLGVLPRATRLRRSGAFLTVKVDTGPKPMFVANRFVSEVDAADAEVLAR